MTIQQTDAPSESREVYLSPAQVCEIIPGMTVTNLAALRFRGKGPRYRKPTERTVIYAESDVRNWVEGSARQGTAPDAA